jgi:hypothetical protein
MASKCCSKCAYTLPLSSFLKDLSDPKSRSLLYCIKCRAQATANRNKRKALQSIDPNITSKKPAITRTKSTEDSLIPHILSETRPQASIYSHPPLESRPQPPQPPPIPPSIQPAGFLPPDQWKLIQDFHTALDKIQMEYCLRCRERWFAMCLRNEICDACFLRDKGS